MISYQDFHFPVMLNIGIPSSTWIVLWYLDCLNFAGFLTQAVHPFHDHYARQMALPMNLLICNVAETKSQENWKSYYDNNINESTQRITKYTFNLEWKKYYEF